MSAPSLSRIPNAVLMWDTSQTFQNGGLICRSVVPGLAPSTHSSLSKGKEVFSSGFRKIIDANADSEESLEPSGGMEKLVGSKAYKKEKGMDRGRPSSVLHDTITNFPQPRLEDGWEYNEFKNKSSHGHGQPSFFIKVHPGLAEYIPVLGAKSNKGKD